MGFNGREEYGGYWVTSWVLDGVPTVAVFDEERGRRAVKSWRGVGDVRVAHEWIDGKGGVVKGEGMDWERMRQVMYEEARRAIAEQGMTEAEFERQRKEQEKVKVNERASEAKHLIASGMLGLGRLPESVEEVNAAFRKQAKVHHPDKGGDVEVMRRLSEARDLLLLWLK
jgi:hypothetical protein